MRAAITLFTLVLSIFFLQPTYAATAQPFNEAQVKLNLIHQLESDGYLSSKLATDAKNRYVDPAQLAAPGMVSAAKPSESLWDRYWSWTNLLKVAGVIFLLIAFYGTIVNIAKGVWHLLVMVPTIVYQLPLLALTVFATVCPQMLWPSQALYIAFFGAIANLVVAGWIVVIYPKVADFLEHLFKLGIPVGSVLSFWGMLYFGGLAFLYQSQLFGFLAAVCVSGILTFGMYYSRGVLTLSFDESATGAVVFGHLVVLGAYIVVRQTLPHLTGLAYFTAGLEYYCAIALMTGLLVGSAPFGSKRKATGLYVLFMVAVVVAATAGYFLLDLKVIGSIAGCFFVLFVIEWLAYLGFQGGVIVGSAVVGVALYALSLAAQHFGQYIVLATV